MKKLLLSVSALLISSNMAMAGGASGQSNDTYVQGFAAYAKELGNSHSIQNYLKDIEAANKEAGYIGKKLHLPPVTKVADGVYTIVGSLIWHTPENYGLNNNLTFIEFEDGVFVFNAGPNPAVAKAFHKIIKDHTSKPVKWVAVENSQGHAYLGSSYWVDMGVKNLYSHSRANQDFHNGFEQIKGSWSKRVGENITFPARDVSSKFTEFEDKLVINVGGGETIEFLNFGPGHTPGSTLAYIPSRNILLTGDVAYNKRALALFSYTNTADWVNTFEAMMTAMPKDVLVIPGHGEPTDMNKVKTDTLDYLVFLRNEVKTAIENGKKEADMGLIDQSKYKDRPVYEQTYEHNAVHIYKEMTGGDLGESFE